MQTIKKNKLIKKKIHIFDFDGVIVDSMKIKGNAFCDIFDFTSDLEKKKIIRFHLKNGSLSRQKKIQFIFEKILKIKINKADTTKFISKKSSEFKNVYFKNIKKIKLIKGIKVYLKILKKRKNKIYIVSAAPLKEIKLICQYNNINDIFDKIYDKKKSKEIHLKMIKKINKNKSFIYYGDSMSDFFFAKQSSIDFCAVLTNNYSNLKKTNNYINIHDFL